MFIKNNMSRDVDAASRAKTFIAFVLFIEANEGTLGGSKTQFMMLVWSQVGVRSTPKHLKEVIIWWLFEDFFIWRYML